MSEEKNREVDTAWRATSSEEPPPHLDAIIRAEARRAVGAGPGDERRRRYRQWRYPFAAAATVALLAFGIVQMTPPDQIVTSVVSDQPAAPRDRAPPPQTPAPPTQLAENVAPAPPPARPAENALTASPPPRPAEKALAASPPRLAENAPAAPVQTAPSSAARQQASTSPKKAPSAPTPVPPSNESGALSQHGQSAASDAAAKKDAQPKQKVEGERFAAAPAAQAPASAAGSVAENAPRSEPFPAASPSAGAPSPHITYVDEVRAKRAGAESVEAWIARIRALRATGDLAAAGREIAAFRDAFGDRADTLLPRDLRGFTASDGKGQ